MGKHKKKDKKHKEKKEKRKHKKEYSSDSSTSEDEWVEKKMPVNTKESREEWMSLNTLIPTVSKLDRRKEKEINNSAVKESEKYNPGTNARELNPYWKNDGDGLPTKKNKFVKPPDDFESRNETRKANSYGWQKSTGFLKRGIEDQPSTSKVEQPDEISEHLSETDMNEIAAKIVKAEILGDSSKVMELKKKLEYLQSCRSELRIKKQKLEPSNRQSSKYLSEYDKHSLKDLFVNEKANDIKKQNLDILKIASKMSSNDNLDDLFADNIEKIKRKDDQKRPPDYRKYENCRRCLQTTSKHLIVGIGETLYLSLPAHEPLTDGHCTIIPIGHVKCSTYLDENEWLEVLDVRKALTKMFLGKDRDVIFFETVTDSYPHMVIQCVPVPSKQGALAPMYFKKAIDECETKWSLNKKFIDLTGRDLRKVVPKGLSYFHVAFGVDAGFAHVIEDQKYFPRYFAEEIIGGMLNLHHSKWRKGSNQQFDLQKARVLQFSNEWKMFDCFNQ